MTKPPFSVYSTWGLHDELGDRVELSEALARAALGDLRRWARHGVKPDYFHLDAFWFDPKRGYRQFKKPHWPRGFGPLRDEILAAGLRPGLWYSTNGYSLDVPAWRESRCANGHCSLVDGPYAEIFEGDLHHAADAWDVRLFKFDFVDFFATPENVRRAPAETYARAVERFCAILRGLRNSHPDIHVIVHCGFARNQRHQRTGWPFPVAADPALLEVVDGYFSGDPQTMDIPQTDLTRNLDLYQDRAVWKLHQAGFPLDRIEDHGAVMATTNTGCYRGRAGFLRTHLGQLARGGRRDLFYGDPRVLGDDDLTAMGRARTLFFDAWNRQLTTRFLGLGEPGLASWHGYLTGGGARGLLYLVNPTFSRQRVELPIVNLATARVLFHDGSAGPVMQAAPDRLTVDLGPEQMTLVGLGGYAGAEHELGHQDDPAPPVATTLLPVIFRQAENGHDLLADLSVPLPEGGRLLVVAEVRDGGPQDPDALLPHLFAAQNTHQPGATMEPQSHALVRIAVTQGRRKVKPERLVPEVPVWAGMSWVAAIFTLPAAAPCRIGIAQTLDPPRRLTAHAYAILDR
ncbi:MAG: hypothetical protein RBU25_09285 [Lentisphaeria bacterium]|jgi:hypothetical protein|nr:hypothetical protein [Lentisphaeria bacterium]